jgi:magnesium transporter
MVRAQLLTVQKGQDGATLISGGVELVEQWRSDAGAFLWLDIVDERASDEEELLTDLGCHPLAIQDAQRDRHPPKFEDFDKFSFLIYRGVRTVGEALNIETVQIGFFVGTNLLITRRNGPSFGVERVWSDPAHIEELADPAILMSHILKYSAHVYLEAVLDFETRLSEIEDSMSVRPDDTLMQELIGYKSSLRKLRRIFNYHERILDTLLKEPGNYIDTSEEELRHAIQDIYDKFERLRSLSALYYDICGDLIEGYLSISAHKLNRTMQVLTVITAIFIPLGLMAGIYGMNFDNMPELHSANGYYILLGVMFSTAVVLLLLFRRKGWL